MSETHDVTRREADGADLRIVEIDPGSDRWRAWVARRPDALVYHHPAWIDVLRETYDYAPACLGCEDPAGVLRGVLPLLATHGMVTGRRLSSLPHTPVAGPLADTPAIAGELVRGALQRVRVSGVRLQLKAATPTLAVDGLARARWDDTYVLELPEHAEDLRFGSGRNHARIRWAARKADKHGVRVRMAETEEELRAWYRLYLETMRSHSVPPRPLRLFSAMWRVLRPLGMMRLALAEMASGGAREILAGSLILTSGHTAAYAFNGRRRDQLGLRPNDVIQWTVIPELCAGGVRSYDMGEVTTGQAGLADFKSKWGAEPRALYRYHHPPARRPATGRLAPGTRLRRTGEAAWRRLPLAATARLGDWLYGHA
jgi:hypothetical protein